jgi:hypothetical protein
LSKDAQESSNSVSNAPKLKLYVDSLHSFSVGIRYTPSIELVISGAGGRLRPLGLYSEFTVSLLLIEVTLFIRQ